MWKVVLIAGVVFCSSTAAMAQTTSNTRDGNGNLVRRTAPINNTPPMINSTANNPARRPPILAPTADQNLSPTSNDVSRMLGQQK
jgi:YD repeat-containing protein